MGQGGYITIHNDTDYDMEKVKGGAYQMAFDSPQTIPAHQSRKFYAEWWESGVKEDDSAYADYKVMDGTGRIVTIEAWARPNRHFQMNFKSYSQPGYPVGTIKNIGWTHDGNVGFRVQGSSPPKPDPCFLAGSPILTQEGYVPVERLELGQKVVVLDKGVHVLRDIVFLGKGRREVDCSGRLAEDESGWPVCIKANAFGPQRPRRDLWMTAEHCVFVHDALVPVRLLVNGESIFYDLTQPSYDFYHVGTDLHSVLAAENLYAESYLPGDNAVLFASQKVSKPLLATMNTAYPVRTDREFVERVFNELVGKARQAHGSLEENVPHELALHLTRPDGTQILPSSFRDDTAVFELDGTNERLFIRSQSRRPCDFFGRFVDDRRQLGALISSVSIRGDADNQEIGIDFMDPNLRGWCAPEGTSMRWTQGSGEIVLPDFCQTSRGVLTVKVLPSELYYLHSATGRLQEKADVLLYASEQD